MDENLYESRSAAPWNRNQTAETVENAPPKLQKGPPQYLSRSFVCLLCDQPIEEYPPGNMLGKSYWVHGHYVEVCQKCQTALVEDKISQIIRGDSR